MMNFNTIRPDDQTIVIEHQATGETPVHVTPEGTQPVQLHQTNADHIRAMSDEELAEMMAHGNCGYCKIHDYCFSQKGVDCDEAWLDWLKQATEEGE